MPKDATASVADALRAGKVSTEDATDALNAVKSADRLNGVGETNAVKPAHVESKDVKVIRSKGGQLATAGTSGFFGEGGVLSGLVDDEEAEEMDAATMENVDAAEIRIPRMAIMQPLSPLATGRDAKFKEGQVVDNVDSVLLSREVQSPWLEGKVADGAAPTVDAVLFIPIFKLPNEFIKWKDRSTEGRGMHWKTLDRKERRVREGCWPPYGNWQPAPDAERRSPPVTVNINFAGCVIEAENLTVLNELCIVTFSKTSNAAGKDLTTKIARAMKRNVPIFGLSYWLWVHEEYDERSNSTYYSFRIAPGKSIIELWGENVPAVASRLLAAFKEFSNKDNGRAAQEGFLNASSLDEDGWEEDDLDLNAGTPGTANAIDVAAKASGDDEPKF